jgi:DNA transformation protein
MSLDSYTEFLKDQLEPLGGVTFRKMFGGVSAYRDGMIFGIAVADTLYFKADEETIPSFEAEGCGPFTYGAKDGRTLSMAYYRVPERLFDEPDDLLDWARAAVSVSRRADAAKAAKKKPARRGAGASRSANSP